MIITILETLTTILTFSSLVVIYILILIYYYYNNFENIYFNISDSEKLIIKFYENLENSVINHHFVPSLLISLLILNSIFF